MLSHKKFSKEIVELYKKLNLKYDKIKFSPIKTLDKLLGTGDMIESASYIFPPASGKYRRRNIEIAPSYYPFIISDVDIKGNLDDALLGQLNPSLIVQTFASTAAYNYLVVRMKMNIDIGLPPIMIYPKTLSNKIGGLTMFRRSTSTNYKKFNNRYMINLGNQSWFLRCLNKKIMDLIIGLKLPTKRGAVFQFSKKYGTFSILPRAIGKEKLLKILVILERIINKIEKEFKKEKIKVG